MSRKLLLADDSVTIQKVIGITFVNEDFKLSVVDNGDAALDKARAERPDLILADVFMPGKNGYELCAAVKADPALSRVPVLLLTGTFEPFDEAKAKACGAEGWIAKPFESQTLINRVKELLRQAESAPPAVSAPVAAAAPQAPVAPVVPPTPLVPAAPAADMWAELAEEEPVAAEPSAVVAEAPLDADFSGIFGDVEEVTPVEPAAEDIWGAVSFADEDLGPTSIEPPELVTDDIWGELETSASASIPAAEAPFVSEPLVAEAVAAEIPVAAPDDFSDSVETTEDVAPVAAPVTEEELLIFAEEPAVSVAETVEEDEVMELDEEDILLLDEAEIVTEEVARPEPLIAPESAETDDFVFVAEEEVAVATESSEDIPPIVEDIFAFDEAPEAVETTAAMAEEPVFPDLFVAEPVAAVAPELESEPTEVVVAEPAPVAAFEEEMLPELGPVAVVEEFVVSEAAPVVEEGGMAPPMPEPVAAVAVAAAEAQVQTLGEAELAAIVEKVAGAVIERLAGSILEKIAWEVVPDLAESLIKEELRQIKAEVGQPG